MRKLSLKMGEDVVSKLGSPWASERRAGGRDRTEVVGQPSRTIARAGHSRKEETASGNGLHGSCQLSALDVHSRGCGGTWVARHRDAVKRVDIESGRVIQTKLLARSRSTVFPYCANPRFVRASTCGSQGCRDAIKESRDRCWFDISRI